MSKIILLTLVSLLFQSGQKMISPDMNYQLLIEMKEESDLQRRYISTLISKRTNASFQITNCVRRDLPAPNFYWDKDSKYLVFENCSESFKDSRIQILNLETRKILFELNGLIGNEDKTIAQFDSNNDILIYFDTKTIEKNIIPSLYAFDIKKNKKRLIQKFSVVMDIEFPQIRRIEGKRKIEITYNDNVLGQSIIKEVDY